MSSAAAMITELPLGECRGALIAWPLWDRLCIAFMNLKWGGKIGRLEAIPYTDDMSALTK